VRPWPSYTSKGPLALYLLIHYRFSDFHEFRAGDETFLQHIRQYIPEEILHTCKMRKFLYCHERHFIDFEEERFRVPLLYLPERFIQQIDLIRDGEDLPFQCLIFPFLQTTLVDLLILLWEFLLDEAGGYRPRHL